MIVDEQEGKRIFGSDNTMGLFVALYLILLAFFIVLTSVSNHAASRGGAVMDSVNDTFRQGSSNVEDIDPRAIENAANDPALSTIQRSFISEMQLEGRFSQKGGGSFEVQFPESLLFQPGSFRVRQNMAPFLEQLLSSLRDTDSVARHEIAFMFGVGVGSVDREPTRSQEIAIRRAGSLARYLETSGIERDRYTTGFVGIPEGQILAVFYRDLPAGSRNTLGTSREGVE